MSNELNLSPESINNEGNPAIQGQVFDNVAQFNDHHQI